MKLSPVFEFNRYRGSELCDRIQWLPVHENGLATVETPDGTWRVDIPPIEPAAPGVASRMQARFSLIKGRCENASVGVAFHLPDWSEQVHVFMPGAVYMGNRFRCYPCGWYGCYEPQDAKPNAEQIVARIPQLNLQKGAQSRIQMLSRDLTTPAVGFWYPDQKLGVFLMTNQGIDKGDVLLEVEESPAHDDAWVRLTLPGVREINRYDLDGAVPSPDRGATFVEGETVELEWTTHSFFCDDLRSFHECFFGIRKQGLPDRQELPGVTLSRAMEFQHEAVSVHRWSDTHQLFWDEPAAPWFFQTGWTGGMIKDYPVLASGTQSDRQHVEAALNTYHGGWSQSGLMHGRLDPSGAWTSDNEVSAFPPLASRPYMKDWTLARRHGDVLYYLIKTARLLKERNPDWIPPQGFYQKLANSADVLCRTFERHGQLGQYLDQKTGDIRVGGSTSAASVPSGLLMAWREFGNVEYLETARALAVQLYETYAACGNMNGTPADVLQSPDCEGPTLLLDGMCDLFDVDGDPVWLRMAEHCAWLLATWVHSYDYDFSRHFPDCEFQRLGLKTTGAINASSQNRIGTPGLCVSSGLSLLRLYRATREVRFLELLRDIVFCQLRAMGRPDRPSFGEDGKPIPPGWIAERFSTSDVHMPGTFWNTTTPWCQTAMMLACLEIPSLYVIVDQGLIFALDTIRVDEIVTTRDGLQVTLTNPTSFPARYQVMCEESGAMAKPLPCFHFQNFQSYDFKPDETRVISMPLG